jgi:hypothetical protein
VSQTKGRAVVRSDSVKFRNWCICILAVIIPGTRLFESQMPGRYLSLLISRCGIWVSHIACLGQQPKQAEIEGWGSFTYGGEKISAYSGHVTSALGQDALVWSGC